MRSLSTTGRQPGESAGGLKAILIHYPTSSTTITSSPRHFQVDLSPIRPYWCCPLSLHTAADACSPAYHLISSLSAISQMMPHLSTLNFDYLEAAGEKCILTESGAFKMSFHNYVFLYPPTHLFSSKNRITLCWQQQNGVIQRGV